MLRIFRALNIFFKKLTSRCIEKKIIFRFFILFILTVVYKTHFWKSSYFFVFIVIHAQCSLEKFIVTTIFISLIFITHIIRICIFLLRNPFFPTTFSNFNMNQTSSRIVSHPLQLSLSLFRYNFSYLGSKPTVLRMCLFSRANGFG